MHPPFSHFSCTMAVQYDLPVAFSCTMAVQYALSVVVVSVLIPPTVVGGICLDRLIVVANAGAVTINMIKKNAYFIFLPSSGE